MSVQCLANGYMLCWTIFLCSWASVSVQCWANGYMLCWTIFLCGSASVSVQCLYSVCLLSMGRAGFKVDMATKYLVLPLASVETHP